MELITVKKPHGNTGRKRAPKDRPVVLRIARGQVAYNFESETHDSNGKVLYYTFNVKDYIKLLKGEVTHISAIRLSTKLS